MESQLLKEWTAEERKEAAEAAAKEATIAILLELLDEKFDFVPGHVQDRLHAIEDPAKLKYLTKKIIKAATMEEFEGYLEIERWE